MYSVYALVDPRTDEVKYIGCSLNAQRRFSDHVRYQKGPAKKQAWIDELKNQGLLPTLLVLEEGLKEPDCWGREAGWIRHYSNLGASLTNVYRPDPKKTVNRVQSTYYCLSQEDYDYQVSLGRNAVLRSLR